MYSDVLAERPGTYCENPVLGRPGRICMYLHFKLCEKLILHHLTEKCEEKTTGVLYGDYFFPH